MLGFANWLMALRKDTVCRKLPAVVPVAVNEVLVGNQAAKLRKAALPFQEKATVTGLRHFPEL
jgi:hypothetical protein